MPSDPEIKGRIFSIARASGEDGPGIRTTLFLKGCPLQCIWCHSPQSQGSEEPRLTFYENRCIRCGACLEACSKTLHRVNAEERQILWDDCDHCGKCAEVCPSNALEMAGDWMTVEQVLDAVNRDIVYYNHSQGGVTFSGGEPTLQPDFLKVCLKKCKAQGIHTAVDTCGFVKWSVLEELLPHIDLFLFDIKHMDNETHRQLTGVTNNLILENLSKIDRHGKSIWIRIPLIPDQNDSEKNLRAIAHFVQKLRGVEKVSLLNYSVAAGAKYPSIGQQYPLGHVNPHDKDKENKFLDFFSSLSVNVEVGR